MRLGVGHADAFAGSGAKRDLVARSECQLMSFNWSPGDGNATAPIKYKSDTRTPNGSILLRLVFELRLSDPLLIQA
jgi:hypothetical protein